MTHTAASWTLVHAAWLIKTTWTCHQYAAANSLGLSRQGFSITDTYPQLYTHQLVASCFFWRRFITCFLGCGGEFLASYHSRAGVAASLGFVSVSVSIRQESAYTSKMLMWRFVSCKLATAVDPTKSVLADRKCHCGHLGWSATTCGNKKLGLVWSVIGIKAEKLGTSVCWS